jgi:hypothetical protein
MPVDPRRERLVGRVRRMLQAYPHPPRDPYYVSTVARALEQFSDVLVASATDPVHGCPRRHKDFPPSAGQVVRWCEDHMPRVIRNNTEDTPTFAKLDRPTREEIEAKLGRKVQWENPARLRTLPIEATLTDRGEQGDFSRITAP